MYINFSGMVILSFIFLCVGLFLVLGLFAFPWTCCPEAPSSEKLLDMDAYDNKLQDGGKINWVVFSEAVDPLSVQEIV